MDQWPHVFHSISQGPNDEAIAEKIRCVLDTFGSILLALKEVLISYNKNCHTYILSKNEICFPQIYILNFHEAKFP